MLRDSGKLLTLIHTLLDLGLTMLSFCMAYYIKKDFLPVTLKGLSSDPDYIIVLLMILIIWYFSFNLFNLYSSFRTRSFLQIFLNFLKSVLFAMLILTLCIYLFKILNVSRLMLLIFFILNVTLLVLSKYSVYKTLINFRSKGYNSRNILILGSKDRAKSVISDIKKEVGSGFRIIGCIETDPASIGKSVISGIKVIGSVNHLKEIMTERVVDELIFAMPLKDIKDVDDYLDLAETLGISVRIIPNFQIHYLLNGPRKAIFKFEEFSGNQTLTLDRSPLKDGMFVIKNIIDYTFSFIALICFLPFFCLIALVIKIVSPGPVFFKQIRCGLNGRKFFLYKFRTMVPNAEELAKDLVSANEADGPAFKVRNDPRIIPIIGTFLRKSSLDELPQLINILKGEMSLVGPRPPVPGEVNEYKLWQRRRLSMKPGLTCTWQVRLKRNEISFKEWMNMDLFYIDNWSLLLDFKILFSTTIAVLMGAGR